MSPILSLPPGAPIGGVQTHPHQSKAKLSMMAVKPVPGWAGRGFHRVSPDMQRETC